MLLLPVRYRIISSRRASCIRGGFLNFIAVLRKRNHRAFAPGGQKSSSKAPELAPKRCCWLDADLVVELARCRRLGHDRLDPKTVDRFALVLRASGEDFDLIAGPFVGVAKCVRQCLKVG